MKLIDPDPAPEPKDPEWHNVVVVGETKDWVVNYCAKIEDQQSLMFSPEGYLWTQPLPRLHEVDEVHVITQYKMVGLRGLLHYAKWLNEVELRSIPITEVIV